MNFIRAEKRKTGQEAARRRIRSILLLLPFVMMLGFLQDYIDNREKAEAAGRRILELRSRLNDAGIREEMARISDLEQDLELLEAYEAEVEKEQELKGDRAVLTGSFLRGVEHTMGNEVEMVWEEHYPVHYEEGVLTFTAQTDIPEEASRYVEKLKDERLFEHVEYGGFERGADEKEENGTYLFMVKCRLPAQEQEGETHEKTE